MRKVILILVGVALLYAGYRFFSGNGHFKSYKVDKTFIVDFSFPDLAREEFSDREKADQARDWLLYSLISNSGLDLKHVAEATFDLAPVRYGFNNTLANFDYGDTRSKFIGDGHVLALIPISDDKTRNDNIAHILDDTRKNQGDIPETVFVFEYDLNTEGNFARLTRRENLDAGEFFTEKNGYYESPIRNLEDLKSFMEKTDDITFAKNDNNNLVFGGRHLFGHKYGRATPEDVAAIWQSEKYIEENQGKTNLTDKNIELEWNAAVNSALDHYNEVIKSLTFEDGMSFEVLPIDDQNKLINYIGSTFNPGQYPNLNKTIPPYGSDANVISLIKKIKAEIDSIDKKFLARSTQNHPDGQEDVVASSSGFSLDPAVNFEKSIEFVKKNRYWFEEALKPDITVSQLLDQLEHKNGDLMSYAIQKVGMSWGGLLGLEEEARRSCIYQKARYDGKLQGTEVGMTLFYTDLLAKIWAGNRFYSKPIDFIAGFKDHEQSYMSASKVFSLESESLSAVRLWFGPNKNGFQTSNEKSELTFSRNATQIYALSNDPSEKLSDDLKNKNIEKQASAEFEIALSWWNNHFEEVAEFEPQYERLNEIMKWSTIISWLNVSSASRALNFLDDYTVNRNLWFSDWARANKNLKFRDWEKVSFFNRGFLGNNTEAIPILFSPNKLISGGVSLAEKSLIRESPGILKSEMSVMRRANIEADISNGENAFKTFKETKIKFAENPDAKIFNIDVTPKEGFKLRNRFGEIENSKFEWNIATNKDGGFAFQSKLGETSIGELRSTKAGNGFSIGFESKDIDKGMALARQSSDYVGDMSDFLLKHPEVVRYVPAKNGEWCVQLKNSDDWMIMRVNSENAKGTVNLEGGWQARTSGSKESSKIVEMKWVKEADAQKYMKEPLPSVSAKADVMDEAPEALKKRLIEVKGEKGALAELDLIRRKSLKDIEQLTAQKEFEKAASQIEKVIKHFGETPELTANLVRCQLRAGLKAIESGDLFKSARFMNEALSTRKSSMAKVDVLREFDGFVGQSKISAADKFKIENMANMYLTDQQLLVAGNWEGYGRLAKQVPKDAALSKSGVKFIYEDNPAFSNIDPYASLQTNLAQIREMQNVHIYDISATAIGKNTRMYASVEGKLGREGERIQQLRLRVSPGSSTKNCKDQDNDGNCDDIYSIQGTVYFVAAPSMN